MDRGICESREKAKRAVLAGQVVVNDCPASKAGQPIRGSDRLFLKAIEKYVSRGGHKLEAGLVHFGRVVKDLTLIDLGASTGGFTDCLLQAGASKVFAVDVGMGQLAWKLRQNPRVVVMEKTNARHLTPQNFGYTESFADAIVVDCSFISLKNILPSAIRLLRPDGWVIALIKPQFEAGKQEVDRGEGVIRDPSIHARVLDELESFVSRSLSEMVWCGVYESPLIGPAGNKEFLALLKKEIQ